MVLSVVEPLRLCSVRSFAACWRTSDGILAATGSGVDPAVPGAASGAGAADAGPKPTARDRTTAPTAAAAIEDLRTRIPSILGVRMRDAKAPTPSRSSS